jgi:glucose/arabinose dehydrogenase
MNETHARPGFDCWNVPVILLTMATAFSVGTLGLANVPSPSAKPWLAMDRGPYFTASIESSIPERSMSSKGLAIRVNEAAPAYVVFDTDLLRYSVGWTGGSIDYHSVVFDGSHRTWPKVVGDQLFGTRMAPGWAHAGSFDDPRQRFASTDYTEQPATWRNRAYGPLPHDWAQYKGLYLYGQQVVLSYTVSGTAVLDSPGWEQAADGLFTRTVNIEKSADELVLNVLEHPANGGGIASVDAPDALAPSGPAKGTVVRLGNLNSASATVTKRPVAPADGRVASWTFNEIKGQTVSATPAEYAAELVGGTIISGIFDKAIAFKANGYALVKQSDGIDLGKDFSISAWIKTAAGGSIFSKAREGKWTPGGKTFFIEGGVLTFDVGWVGAVRGSTKINNDQWHHVAITHAAKNGSIRLYVDGAEDNAAKLKLPPDPPESQVRFGMTSKDFPRGDGNHLDGALEEIHLYRRVLQPKEIAGLCPEARHATPPVMVAAVGAAPEMTWELTGQSQLRLHIPAAATPTKLKLLIGGVPKAGPAAFFAAARASAAPVDLSPLTHGGPPRWPEKITTSGTLGTKSEAYVVDTLALPDENPWKARIRPGGFDFFRDGSRAAVCTWDGDVWIVEGLDSSLTKLTWQRIATGMFQPLGLKIVPDASGVEQIYVCCRDQITRLHDLNGDGETDFYECFNNDHEVTEHFHEFAMGLQTDSEGNFYYTKGARHALDSVVPQHGTLLKVSADGSRTEIVCNGFRAANGFAIGPQGELAATDQEGYWTPANRINLVKPGGFYGNLWSYHGGKRTTADGYDPPMCWMPVYLDRSPAEEVWVTSDQWGPLKGKMLNTSYGTGNLFLAPYEFVDGVPQGGVVPFAGIKFPTGIMRARFHPIDGQLYLCGLVGWSSNCASPGGLYRVRYTGKPVNMPTGLEVKSNGIAITFTDPLDKTLAQDRESYAVQQWQYRWTADYGSKHYSIADPNKIAQDDVPVAAASLSSDGRQVLLTIPGLKPVMQMKIDVQLKSKDGTDLHWVIHNTINRVPGK